VTFGIVAPKVVAGAEIYGYLFTIDNGLTWKPVDPSSTPTSLVISGLTNGTKYSIYLRAVNIYGIGVTSKRNGAAPRTVASAPRITSVSALFKRIKISFDTPVSDGGAPILRYLYSINGGDWRKLESEEGTPTIPHLENGVKYSIRIKAINAAGAGAASEAVEVTPGRVNK